MTRDESVQGFPCTLRTDEARECLRRVLEQIRERQSSDFERLQQQVERIEPLPAEDAEDGTRGSWKRDFVKYRDQLAGRVLPFMDEEDCPGFVQVHEAVTRDALIAVIAHELGHAATQYEDLEHRKSPDPEWDSELAADWYADRRWGFGKYIAQHRKTSNLLHHCARPGETFEVHVDGTCRTYFVSRDYVVHEITETAAFSPDRHKPRLSRASSQRPTA